MTHPIADDALRAVEAARLWEQWLAKRLRTTYPDVSTNVDYHVSYGASGHIGAIVWGLGPADQLLIVIKGINQWTPVAGLPKPDDVLEAQAHLHFYGTSVGIARAQLVYIHRETGAVQLPVDINYNPAVGLQIQQDLQNLRQDIDSGNAPVVPAGLSHDQYPCSWKSKSGGGFCAYYGHCWGAANG